MTTSPQFQFWMGSAFGAIVALTVVAIIARVVKMKRTLNEWRHVSRIDRY
jgi:hypothetical protein